MIAALLTSCLAQADDPLDGRGDDASELILAEEERSEILDLVNRESSTVRFLDEEVPLNLRAAESIVAHRDGPDGAAGTHDDDLFEDLEELDAVPWVGPFALETLRDYVAEHRPYPGEIVEGVRFTGAQAEAVVWGVNRASRDELDYEVGLDIRAAENLTARAPYERLGDIADVHYVGSAALLSLRAHSVVWAAQMP